MRIIPRLDIKNNFVIKGINLEGLRKVGDPTKMLEKYYNEGAHEICLIDAVASLYGRNNLFSIIKEASKNIFTPLTLGGGLRNLSDIEHALNSGADKIAINSSATENPNFISEAVKNFGSSTIMIYVEAKKVNINKWEAYKHFGREPTGLEILTWIKKIQDLGCGEILLTSIDHEGLENGLDYDLLEQIIKYVKVPLIISGGFCGQEDLIKIKKHYPNISISISALLHYNKISLSDIIDK
jgi:cyclase